jgi:hypothetical protein
MTGRQEYDRTKDRQRILDEYMIDAHLVLLGPAEEDPEEGGEGVGGGGGGGPLAPSFFTPSAGTSTHLQHTNQFMY